MEKTQQIRLLGRLMMRLLPIQILLAALSFVNGTVSGLFAGNVVPHGFEKDRKKHSVDIRVVCQEEEIILRIRDDCVPFDPFDRRRILENKDPFANIGIKMVFRIASDVQYRSILGLNVLTIRV